MITKPARILIVDDHPNTASMLARVLSKFETPVDILTAQSGEDALELIGESIVDVLITDFMMAGMSGLDLIEKLNGDRKPSHTIMMTAYDTPGLKISAKRLQVNDYLVKPVQPDKIREIVINALSEIRPQGNFENPISDLDIPAKILIADDNPDNIRLLSVRLQSEGYQFVTAYDGQETLDKIRSENPDLVLLDVNMPRKDGFEVLLEMRSDHKIDHIPVIVVTAARIGAKDVREGLTLGADDYVTKPVDWRELSARIRTKLRVKQAEDKLRQKNQALGALPEFSKNLGDNLDHDQLVSMILGKSIHALSASNGILFIFNSDGTISQIIKEPINPTPWSLEEVKKRLTSEGIIPQVLKTRICRIINNTIIDDSWIQIPNDPTHSAVVIPLTGRRETLGALILTHEKPEYFNSDQLKIIEAIASQAAIAIENAQLFAVEHKRVTELVALNQIIHQISKINHSVELFEEVPGLVRQLLGYPNVAIWSVQNSEITLVKHDALENAPRLSLMELGPQQVAKTGQPIQFSGPIDERTGDRYGKGTPPIISSIAVPIHWNGKLNGIVSSISLKSHAFEESDRVLLETLSSQIGIVLERINLFESVEREQKRLSAVLNAAADAILVLSSEGNLQIINPTGEKLFTDVTARIGTPLPAQKGYDGLIKIIENAKLSGNLEKTEILWPDDRTFSVLVTPIKEGGEVAVLHDVSHFMTLNRLKDEFLATASHDLKNPIFSVMGYSDLIAKVGSLNETQADFLRRIKNSANQMQDLVLNLLEIARIEMETDLKKERVDINDLVDEVYNEFTSIGRSKDQLMKLKLTQEKVYVYGDKMRLQQVVRNLLGNAIKYTPNGGSISISSLVLKEKIRVDFTDTGIGIPEDEIENLFQKFYRVHTNATQDIEGNGLGLAIVKSIVEQHDGEIFVSSSEGQGSCFSFILNTISS